ncbi:MAG: hypothetical protein CL944_01745, partial [Candidatus Diapherotrites archaeon]|nr:hypothetical protein [Candidatus Diapherotrites archaeon]
SNIYDNCRFSKGQKTKPLYSSVTTKTKMFMNTEDLIRVGRAKKKARAEIVQKYLDSHHTY